MSTAARDARAVPATRHRTRSLEIRSNAAGPTITVDGREFSNFCSNDYLGLANHPAVRAAAIDAISHYGVGAGAAALLSGWTNEHQALSTNLASFLQRDRALIFSSGYLANVGLLSALIGRHDEVFHDRLNHASLIDGVRLCGARAFRYRHTELEDLERRLMASRSEKKWIVTDGIFSMDGDPAPLRDLASLARHAGATLVCDDAHGFGVMGGGRGLVSELDLDQNDVPVLMVTFGKALGTVGAAVVGPTQIIETLLQQARTFIYDTALPPAIVAATNVALSLVQNDARLGTKLSNNVAHFHSALQRRDIPAPASKTAIQPIVLHDDERTLAAAQALKRLGYYVRAIRPPTVPEGTSRLRICLSAAHSESQIEGLVEALAGVLSQSSCA